MDKIINHAEFPPHDPKNTEAHLFMEGDSHAENMRTAEVIVKRMRAAGLEAEVEAWPSNGWSNDPYVTVKGDVAVMEQVEAGLLRDGIWWGT